MNVKFSKKRISGVISVVPERVACFDDEISQYPFPEKQTRRLKKIMGFERHRLSKNDSTVSDFCIAGVEYLLSHNLLKKEDIGAIIVVTVSPDYFIPHVSNIIHGCFGLSHDVFCMDIPQACCGYLYGILQSCCILNLIGDKKVLLFNGDVLSHRICKKDRSEFPLTGDATAITVFENNATADDIYINICSNGRDRDALIIPAGGFAHPSSAESSIEKKCEDGNIRTDNDLYMNGSKVFDFVTESVPTLFRKSMEDWHYKQEDVDYFLFHQPNKYLLDRLGMELAIPEEKFFTNIVENFGNPHGASIPLNMTYNLSNTLVHQVKRCCLSGFGAGLTYGICLMNLGKMNFCNIIEVDL